MTTVLTALAALHVLALAGVLLAARKDVVLVDEHGRPAEAPAWREQVVPMAEAEAERAAV